MKRINQVIRLGVGIAFLFTSCVNDETGDGHDGSAFDRQALLTNYANNKIAPSYAAYFEAVSDLKGKVVAFETNTDATTLEALKTAFSKTYLDWQNVGFYEFGVASEQILLDNTNLYPCDTATIESNIESGNYNLDALGSSDIKGLPTVDYLLFAKATAETVSAFENSAERFTYLNAIVEQLYTKAQIVHSYWSDESNKEAFVANDGNAEGSSISEMVNGYVRYFEKHYRSGKVGIPVGKAPGLLDEPLPEKSEALYSENSIELLKESTAALERFYYGNSSNNTSGLGLDDYLIAVGNQEFHATIAASFTAIKADIDQINKPMNEAVTENTDQIVALYTKIQGLHVTLKNDMTSALGILINYQDNDGD
jgi:predicted lipoprotein